MIEISNRLNLNAEALLETFGIKESDLTDEAHWQELASRTFGLASAVSHNDGLSKASEVITSKATQSQREISLSFVSAAEIQQLNKEYRSKDAVTDVLSFEIDNTVIASDAKQSLPLGDIVICLERAQEQAQDLNQSLMRELSFLFVHGLLHLLGYDHMQEPEAEQMYALQRRILN